MTLQDKIADYGISPPTTIIADGTLHRFKSEPKASKQNGWYVLHDNSDFQAGSFGCWKQGINENFISVDEKTFTLKQKQAYAKKMKRAKALYKQEKTNKQDKAKQLAQKRFNRAKTDDIGKHTYLSKKQVKGVDLRFEDGLLLVPMYYDGEIVNIQTINAKGDKYFSVGGRIKGTYHLIGEPKNKIIICEGWATGASIYQASSECVAVCFNAGNLEPAAKHLKQLYPNYDFLIAGDNDRHNQKNTGKESAIKTARALNCEYVLPVFKGSDLSNKPTDFNDVHCLYGLNEVKTQIQATPTNPIDNMPVVISLFDDDGKKKTQATILIEITKTYCQLFHNSNNDTFANIRVDGHNEIWQITSSGFKDWLTKTYFNLTDKGVNSTAIRDGIDTINANAKYNGECQEVYLRIAQTDDKIYIDIGDDKWQVIEVGNTGFKVLQKSPVAFVRKNGMLPLPTPTNSNDISLLKKHLNIKEDDFCLVAGWLLMALQNGAGAYPILILQGEQGTAKTTTAKMLRALIDPHNAGVRIAPKQEDLITMACNNYLPVLDNLSGINHTISDTLCCFATGAGQTKRKLYTDNEDSTINLKRPVILNGIDEIATRGDLSSRSVLIDLPALTQRKDEGIIWREFNNDLPKMFGALLNGLAAGLANIDDTKIDNLPRMADFAKWATACGGAYDWGNVFIDTYRENIQSFNTSTVENSPFAMGIYKLADDRIEWQGTATLLLDELDNYVSDRVRCSHKWMTTPRAVTNQLQRWTPQLKTMGVMVTKFRNNGQNVIKIKKQRNQADNLANDEPF